MNALRRLSTLLFFIVTLAAPFARGQEADLLVTKSGPAEAAAGSDVPYDIVVTNLGPDSAVNVTINDDIPAGMTFVSATQTGGPPALCSTPDVGDPGSVTCTLQSLDAGLAVQFTFVFNIPVTTTPGTVFTNFITKSSETFDPNEENDAGVATTTTPPPPQSDLLVTKSAAEIAGPDTDIAFTITIGNGGPDAAQNLTLTDTLPGDLEFVSLQQENGPTLSCTTPAIGSGGTITCTAATFAAGASATFTLTAHVPAGTPFGTTYTNTAAITAESDPNEENNVATTTVTTSAVDLVVTKTGPATAIAGENISYAITLRNDGPDPAMTVELTDVIPAGATFVSLAQTSGPALSCSVPPAGGTGTITCTRGFLAPGSTAALTLVVNAGDVASIENTASATPTESFETDPADNQATVTTNITPNADLSLLKSGPATVDAGSNITYSITVANGGVSAAANVSLSDALPAETTFVSLTQTSGPTFSCTTPAAGANGTVTCTAATLAANAAATFQLVASVASGATGSVDNTAMVTSTTGDTDAADNTSTVNSAVSTSADVAVTKDAAATVTAGTTLSYTIAVTNNGPSDAATVSLTDVLPAQTTFASLTQTAGPAFSCTTPAVGATGTVTCNVATLTANATATFTLVVDVAPDASGTISNTATVATTTADPASGNDTSTESTTIVATADVAVTKDGPASATPGSTISYTIGVMNNGPSDAPNVTLTDVLPANTTFASATQTAGPPFTCTTPAVNATGTITCTLAALADSGSAAFTIVLNIAPGATGSIVNTATVASGATDPVPANDSATETTPLTADADVAVTKSAPATAIAGNNVTYTITVTNSGPSNAANVALTDTLPAGTTFVSMTQTAGPAFSCTTTTCTIASLAAGSSATFELVANINPGTTGTVTNTAAVTSDSDTTPGNNTANAPTAVTASADVAVAKTGPEGASAGTDVTYTITVTNSGPSDASNVTLTDTLPPQATLVSMTQTAGPTFTCVATTCTISTLAANATATFTLVAAIAPNATGTITNTATVTSTSADPAGANNTSSVPTTIGANAELTVAKTAPATGTAGTTLTYMVNVASTGPSDANNVTLTDLLPAQTTFVSATQTAGPAFTCTTPAVGANGTITCSIGTFAPASSATFSFVVNVDPSATGTIQNTATVNSSTPDPAPANNTSTASTTLGATADLVVTKTGAAAATAGTDVTYTVTVRNDGPSAAANVTLTDTLPAQTTFVSATQTAGPTFACTTPPAGADGTITCAIGSFAPMSSATFSFVLHVAPNATGSISNTASISSDTADPTPANSSGTMSTAIVTAVTDVSITKAADANNYQPGATATYTLVVTNNGPAIATGITVTDVLPAGAMLISATPTQGTCSGTTTINCNLGNLDAEATATITFLVTLPTMPGPVENTAAVTSDQVDPAPANNTATSIIAIVPAVAQGIPTLSPLAIALLALSMATAAMVAMKGR